MSIWPAAGWDPRVLTAVLIALVTCLWLRARARTRRLVRELELARDALESGDFDRRVAESGDGELGALARKIHLLADELHARYLASILDPVTGAYLWPHFEATLEREIARATRARESVAVLLCEIEDVRAAQEELDGDDEERVLQACVQRWAGCLRETDLVGRYGRREFAFLLPTATLGDALRVADRVAGALRELSLPDRLLTVRCSIGVAVFPQRLTARDLMRGAEAALQAARRDGARKLAVDPESDPPVLSGAFRETAPDADAGRERFPEPARDTADDHRIAAAAAPSPTFVPHFERDDRLPARLAQRPADPVAWLQRGPCPDIGLPLA